MIDSIFAQLHVNSTYFTFFIIFIILFFLTKALFINRLKFVIENREEKTVKLESSADTKMDQVAKLTDEYNQKINDNFKQNSKKIPGFRFLIRRCAVHCKLFKQKLLSFLF